MTAEDRIHLTLNVKDMNVLYNALDSNESIKVKVYRSAKEIWNKLKEIHEGSENVREQKKSILVTKYELFKMESHEHIDKMYCRFKDFIKNLEVLEKKCSLGEKKHKNLECLVQRLGE